MLRQRRIRPWALRLRRRYGRERQSAAPGNSDCTFLGIESVFELHGEERVEVGSVEDQAELQQPVQQHQHSDDGG
jgi:hypothetical protein